MKLYLPNGAIIEGSNAQELLPFMNKEAVKSHRKKAPVLFKKVGRPNNKHKDWTGDELKTIFSNLDTSTKVLKKMLPGRTDSAVSTKKFQMRHDCLPKGAQDELDNAIRALRN